MEISEVDTGPQHHEEVIVDDDDATLDIFASGVPLAKRVRARGASLSNYRALPRSDYVYQDCEHLIAELDDWFESDELENLIRLFSGIQACSVGQLTGWLISTAIPAEELQARIVSESSEVSSADLERMCFYALGNGEDGESLENAIIDNCDRLFKIPGLLDRLVSRFRFLCSIQYPGSVLVAKESMELRQSLSHEFFLVLTMIYVIQEALRPNRAFKDAIVQYDLPSLFVHSISRSRLTQLGDRVYSLEKLNLLLWKSMLTCFGGSDELFTVKRYKRKIYGLGPDVKDADPEDIYSSPLEYEGFRADLLSRYPVSGAKTFGASMGGSSAASLSTLSRYLEISRPSHELQANSSSLPAPTIHLATPAPSPPASPAIAAGHKVKKSVFMTDQSYPFVHPSEDGEVPASIREAGELFASRVRISPALKELWDERELFARYERGWLGGRDDNLNQDLTQGFQSRSPLVSTEPGAEDDEGKKRSTSDPSTKKDSDQILFDVLRHVDRFYVQTQPTLSSFVMVCMQQLLDVVSFSIDQHPSTIRSRETRLKALSASLFLLLRWLKASHVLRFEYLSALLFDHRFHLVLYKYLYTQDVRELWDRVDTALVFSVRIREMAKAGHAGDVSTLGSVPALGSGPNPSTAESSSAQFGGSLFSLINMLRILRKMVKKKIQRIIVVGELPSDTLKKALRVYHEQVWRLVLDTVKEQVPFNGRKWKYSNMDMVSAIYLHCKPRLRDDWLVGVDASVEVSDAYPQELALRALTQFYNDRCLTEKALTRELRGVALDG